MNACIRLAFLFVTFQLPKNCLRQVADANEVRTDEFHALIPIVERLLTFVDGLQSLLHKGVLSNLVGRPSTCETPEEEVPYKICIDIYSEKKELSVPDQVSRGESVAVVRLADGQFASTQWTRGVAVEPRTDVLLAEDGLRTNERTNA